MGEEVRIDDSGDDGRVLEREDGLPSIDDLMPLSQRLIPPVLASAFKISPEPSKTMLDVNRASQDTLSSLRGAGQSHALSSSNHFNFKPTVTEKDDVDLAREASESRKIRRIDSIGTEEADDSSSAKNSLNKRPRLVWTPQLHRRFVDVVAHLGIKNAVPKTIMQLMNVEGLTRENVASHLQKYRLYLKRMQGLSNDGPSSSDHLFASTPVPQSSHESSGSGHGHYSSGHMPMPMPIPMPYPPQIVPMPMIGMVGNGGGSSAGFHHNHYNMAQQREWSGNKFASYHHVSPSNK